MACVTSLESRRSTALLGWEGWGGFVISLGSKMIEFEQVVSGQAISYAILTTGNMH